jgi:hypothetical protein
MSGLNGLKGRVIKLERRPKKRHSTCPHGYVAPVRRPSVMNFAPLGMVEPETAIEVVCPICGPLGDPLPSITPGGFSSR